MTTTAELEAMIASLKAQLESMEEDASEEVLSADAGSTEKKALEMRTAFYTTEISKMDRFFSGFTARTSVLITIAGLLSFIPPLVFEDLSYLHNFLTWTLPLLILSIFTYYPSSLRIQSVIKSVSGFPRENSFAEQFLSLNVAYLHIVWERYLDRYKNALSWTRITTGLVYAYILSLVINFYLLAFNVALNPSKSVAILMLSILVSAVMVLWQVLTSKKNLQIGNLTTDIGSTGATPDHH